MEKTYPEIIAKVREMVANAEHSLDRNSELSKKFDDKEIDRRSDDFKAGFYYARAHSSWVNLLSLDDLLAWLEGDF